MALDPPTLPILREMAIEHVKYEVDRVVAFGSYGNAPAHLQPWVVQSLLEAGLVHIRNVVEFLQSPRPTNPRHADDIVADHYFVNGWPNRERCTFPRDKLGDVHKRCVHLTSERCSPTFRWDGWLIEHAPLSLKDFRMFLDDLASIEPKRAAWFDATSNVLRTSGF